MKEILVTGGAGFIGSHLVEELIKNSEHKITVIDDFNDFYDPKIKRRNIEKFLDKDNFTLHKINICDWDSLSKIFSERQFDTIVHLAARAGVRPSLKQPHLYFETNVQGTLNLFELAKDFGISKFIFGSSSSVYGINCKVPFSEEDKISQPISPYASTKISGETICHTYSHLYNISTICLRFFTVYGASQRPDLAIHKFSKLISEEKPIPVFGDGTTKRDYTYIDDIIQGIVSAMNYEKSRYEVFNLGESETVELRRLIELLEMNLGKKAIIDKKPMQAGDVPLTYADITKAKQMLGYSPKVKIEEGIKKFTDWFLSVNKLTKSKNIL